MNSPELSRLSLSDSVLGLTSLSQHNTNKAACLFSLARLAAIDELGTFASASVIEFRTTIILSELRRLIGTKENDCSFRRQNILNDRE